MPNSDSYGNSVSGENAAAAANGGYMKAVQPIRFHLPPVANHHPTISSL